ncbi:MAG: helix-turn-helix transcriptional regulator [Clostridia bacterium]|nr:helix-turn-helix transcriptional regulator [Clostridia bacterium]
MDYNHIGQNIRILRKQNMLSQEQLAEMVGISVTHMSHIETGNTKLSLPVLVDLAKALRVSTDTLLFGRQEDTGREQIERMAELLQDCTTREWYVLLDILQAAKTSMQKYRIPEDLVSE